MIVGHTVSAGLDSLLDKDWRGRGFDRDVERLIKFVQLDKGTKRCSQVAPSVFRHTFECIQTDFLILRPASRSVCPLPLFSFLTLHIFISFPHLFSSPSSQSQSLRLCFKITNRSLRAVVLKQCQRNTPGWHRWREEAKTSSDL